MHCGKFTAHAYALRAGGDNTRGGVRAIAGRGDAIAWRHTPELVCTFPRDEYTRAHVLVEHDVDGLLGKRILEKARHVVIGPHSNVRAGTQTSR